MKYCVDNENSKHYNIELINWLRLQEHRWLSVNKRSKAISRLTGLAAKTMTFPVEVTDSGIVVAGVNYGYSKDLKSFVTKLEEAIENARISD